MLLLCGNLVVSQSALRSQRLVARGAQRGLNTFRSASVRNIDAAGVAGELRVIWPHLALLELSVSRSFLELIS
jgi:hypothetical protein